MNTSKVDLLKKVAEVFRILKWKNVLYVAPTGDIFTEELLPKAIHKFGENQIITIHREEILNYIEDTLYL
ncbi:MAG: hypothetical protein OHK0038_03140 [Flammeovirgaceae bacterium]